MSPGIVRSPVRPHIVDTPALTGGLGRVISEEVLGTEGDEGRASQGDELLGEEECAAGEVIDLDDQEPEEGAQTRRARDPGEPTEQEREAHRDDGHIPYRSWCDHCVEGRGCGEPHKSTDPGAVPVVSFDYLFVTKQGSMVTEVSTERDTEIVLKILVAKDSATKSIFAHVVPTKGTGEDRYAVECLRGDILWLGHTRVLLQSDREPAIKALLQDVLKGVRVSVEQASEKAPAPYDKQANGSVENAVKQIQGQLRTLKSCLEARIGRKVPTEHAIMWWMVRHAAWLLNIRLKGHDGRTAYERTRGRAFPKKLTGFAEVCLYKFSKSKTFSGYDDRGKLAPRWGKAVFLGYDRLSNEYTFCDHGRIVKSRALQRLSASRRWDAQAVEAVTKTPYDGYTRVDTQVVFKEYAEQDKVASGGGDRVKIARDLKIFKRDFERFGYTNEGCDRCKWAVRHGWEATSSLSHSRECRQRMREEIRNSGPEGARRVEVADERANRWIEAHSEVTGSGQGECDADGVASDGVASASDSEQKSREDAPPESPTVSEAERALFGSPPSPTASPAPLSPTASEAERAERALFGPDDDMNAIGNVQLIRGAASIMQMEPDDLTYTLKLVRDLGGDARRMVAEIYSPPRVTAAAKRLPHYGLLPGFAFDLRTSDELGRPWDFDDVARRKEARRRFRKEQPMFLIGSPMCTAFCSWQALNEARHDPATRGRDKVRAMVHMNFVCELYAEQVKAGRYIVHEHPETATSWSEDCVQKIMQMTGVHSCVCDQCQYGQQAADGSPIRKSTKWMTNSLEIMGQLNRRCKGRHGQCTRRKGGVHTCCSGAVARQAQTYPSGLCRAILKGCRRQLVADGLVEAGVVGIQDRDAEAEEIQKRCEETLHEDFERLLNVGSTPGAKYRDSLTGQPLRPELVREARAKELRYFESKRVWTKVKRAEAVARQGKAPITVKWIDINKGDDENPLYRSRLVAREVRKHGEASIFAPTPPLEALRTILSMAATDLPGCRQHCRDKESEERTQVQVVDISRAYFNAVVDGSTPTYVELPEEDEDHGRGICGRLNVHMYGTRRAAEGWHDEYADYLTEVLGFDKGDASACVFRHKTRGIMTSVYGDDFTNTGSKRELDWFLGQLKDRYELIENARLGPGSGDDKETRVLNRIIRWTDSGLEYEADPRQAERLVKGLGLEGAKALTTPGVKVTAEDLLKDETLPEEKTTPFRALAARANYLAADRPECQYAAKEICRWMASPTVCSLAALKRLGRFLEGKRRLVYRYRWQSASCVDIYSDTDWAGCVKTRKSTSGGCVMLGKHLIKSWSSTQSSISLSSGEAEFYGVVKAAGMGLGYRSLLQDIGVTLPLRVWTDSTASMGVCGRRGLGKLRHISTQHLWIQHRVRDGTFELRKVLGSENPADVFTKHLDGHRAEALMRLFECEYVGGRAASAPNLRLSTGTRAEESLLVAGTIAQDGHTYPMLEHRKAGPGSTSRWDGDVASRAHALRDRVSLSSCRRS